VIVAGVDIGAATAKAVILNGNKILSLSIMLTGFSVTRSAEAVIEEALGNCGLSMGQLGNIISTGYGRRAVSFAKKPVTEIICHAASISSVMP
jgi:activator of 2-hydroxyglutaryl-CoA dehydratase